MKTMKRKWRKMQIAACLLLPEKVRLSRVQADADKGDPNSVKIIRITELIRKKQAGGGLTLGENAELVSGQKWMSEVLKKEGMIS